MFKNGPTQRKSWFRYNRLRLEVGRFGTNVIAGAEVLHLYADAAATTF